MIALLTTLILLLTQDPTGAAADAPQATIDPVGAARAAVQQLDRAVDEVSDSVRALATQVETGAVLGDDAGSAAASAAVMAATGQHFFIYIVYLVAAILFVFGLKNMQSPRTARFGNGLAILGMTIAIVITLFDDHIVGPWVIILGILVGSGIGLYAAKVVPMTSMPEMVALFNGSGGAASAVVALAEYFRVGEGEMLRSDTAISIGVSVLIGMVTLTGSLVAFGKLAGKSIGGVRLGNPIVFPAQHLVNLVAIVVTVALIGLLAFNVEAAWAVVLITLIAAALGVMITIPIGGADMPVVVSLLNSYSGLAACATGFVLENTGLIVSGSLVGASGLILTNIMCKAMDRSFFNVMAGGFGQDIAAAGATTATGDLTVRKMDGEEAAMVLEASQNVVIVPGYGMAVAQAQHVVAEMASILIDRGINVRYGIHPVAGRMPGHMNVLLAEANVPYDQLHDLDLNSEMPQIDAVLVIGANDVVNPDARDNPQCQIYGMPIFDVDKAKTVMVCKRSLNPGFAGIENPLFFKENTVMLFGDAKAMITSIVAALKEN